MSDEEVEIVEDDECRLIISDVLHSLIDLSVPPSDPLHEELMPVADEPQIISDQLQGFSSPPMQPDQELMPVDDQCQISSDQSSYPLDPPSKPIDGEPMLVDPLVEHGSQVNKLQGFSEVSAQLVDDKCHGFSYQLDPPSNPLDEELMLVEGSQVKKEEVKQKITSDSSVVGMLQDVEYGELECFQKNEEMLALYSSCNVKEVKLIDVMSKTVSDELRILSEPTESSKLHVLSESSLVLVEELACHNEAAEADNLDYHTFSLANHHFSMIISKSHLSPKYYVNIQSKTTQVLPRLKVPLVLNSYGRIWTTFYNGHCVAKSFEVSGWREFAVDNKLKLGDACFFEVIKNSPDKIVLKVIIVRTNSSPSHVEADGTSADKPMLLD